MYHRTAAEQEIIDSISNYFAQLDWLDVGVRVVAVLGLIAVAYISWPRKKKPVAPPTIGGGKDNSVPQGRSLPTRRNWNTHQLIKPIARKKTKSEVREDAITDLLNKYLDSMFAYLYPSARTAPNETLMRGIEERLGVAEAGVDDFRRSIAAFVGTIYGTTGKPMTSQSHPQLRRALELHIDAKEIRNRV